ncbi:MAG: hypothetical protein R2856_39630 [Caldilineaceae bacterium]
MLILDEPLNGLDPRSAAASRIYSSIWPRGKTIFLSTHDLHTAESVCHRVGIIHQGQLMAEGSAEELRTLAAVPDLESVFLSLTRRNLVGGVRMSIQLNAIAQCRLRAARNGWRQDVRARITAAIQIVLLAGLTIAGALWVSRLLHAWRASGVDLHLHLWLLVLGTWAGVAAFTVIGVVKAGFGSDEARLLMTLPLSPANHFRVLYSLVFRGADRRLLILWLAGSGLVLSTVLGATALPWLLLALVGSCPVTLGTAAIPALDRATWPDPDAVCCFRLKLAVVGLESCAALPPRRR